MLIVGIDHKDFQFRDDETNGCQLFDAFLALLLHTVSSKYDNPKIETFNSQRLDEAKTYIQTLDRLPNWMVF